MRITVKKKEKKQCKPAGLMALVLAVNTAGWYGSGQSIGSRK